MTLLDPEMSALFRSECEASLQVLSNGFQALAGMPPQPALTEPMFRAAHSLKGAARMVGMDGVASAAHHLEDLLDQLRSNRLVLTTASCDVLALAMTQFGHLVDASLESTEVDPSQLIQLFDGIPEEQRQNLDVYAGAQGPAVPAAPAPAVTVPAVTVPAVIAPAVPVLPPPQAAPPPAAEPRQAPQLASTARPVSGGQPAQDVLRIPAARLDNLVGLLSELAASRERLRRLADDAVALHQALEARGRDEDASERRVRQFAAHAVDEQARTELLFHAFDDAVRRLRLVPIEQLLSRVPPQVRDLARRTGKKVDVVLLGDQTAVDKHLVDGLQEPLLHLLANAVDHGIESPEERAAVGKPEAGVIRVEAARTPHGVSVVVQDDGRGVDTEAVRRLAVDRGHLRPEDAAALDEPALLRLLLQPGWTTRQSVTQLSGRGVGLDAVASQVKALRGQLTFSSIRGKGVRFEMDFPSRMATVSVLVIRVGEALLGVPSQAVRACVCAPAASRSLVAGREAIKYGEKLVAVTHLGRVLGFGGGQAASSELVVVLQANHQTLAFEVDVLIGERELVQKPMPSRMRGRGGVGGVAELGDGSLCMLLEPEAIIAAAQLSGANPARPARQRRRRVLVVDDSLTTRAQLRRILESGGYEVVLAVDGLDAWAKIENHSFDAVVSDVEMPNLGGVELVGRIRASSSSGQLPVILCTTLASDADRERGMAAGANAYVTKGGFDQSALLRCLEELL